MAFTYSLSTDVGKVRLKVADTNSAAYAFEDAEIQAFLDEGGTVTKAAILAIQTLIMDAARRQRAFSLPGMTYSDVGRVAALQQALKNLGGDLPTASTITPAVLPMDEAYEEVL